MRYVFQYIIHNIPFLVGIIVLIAFLWYVFMRSSGKEYIRNNIFFCFLLCVMTLLTDCIFFWPEVRQKRFNVIKRYSVPMQTLIPTATDNSDTESVSLRMGNAAYCHQHLKSHPVSGSVPVSCRTHGTAAHGEQTFSVCRLCGASFLFEFVLYS